MKTLLSQLSPRPTFLPHFFSFLCSLFLLGTTQKSPRTQTENKQSLKSENPDLTSRNPVDGRGWLLHVLWSSDRICAMSTRKKGPSFIRRFMSCRRLSFFILLMYLQNAVADSSPNTQLTGISSVMSYIQSYRPGISKEKKNIRPYSVRPMA